MAKKQKKRKGNSGNGSLGTSNQTVASTVAVRKAPEISAFWVAIIIPVICFVGAWSFPPVATPMELKSYTSQIYLSGLLFLWLCIQKQELRTLKFSPARICIGLLFLAGTLSLIWASNPDFWVYKWNKWFAGFVMFFLGLQISQHEKNLDTALNLAIFGGLIVAVIGSAQYLFGFTGVPQTAFPASTFGNGNMAGQVMVLTALLPLYFLFKENLAAKKVWFYAISFALLLAYAYYTRTRAVWLACGLEILLISAFIFFDKTRRANWLFWNKGKTQASIAAFGLFLVLINFNQQGFQPFWEIALYEISSIATDVNTTADQVGGERYLIWGSAAEMVKENPIMGTGLGSFFENVNKGDYQTYRVIGVQRVHNDVLELLVELGVIGFLLLLSFIISMCILLYKLILRSDGNKRKLFSILTIAITASMLNAQLSFPYQLPVPLVIMPFYLALIIRGYEDIELNYLKLSVKPFFSKLVITATGIIFLFITANDLAWFSDINKLNKIVAGENNGSWKPVNPIYNQAYITGSRAVGQALKGTGRDQLSLRVIGPMLEYWPDSTANSSLAAENYLNVGNYPQAEIWAKKTIESQMADSYIGEYFLMETYQRQGQQEQLIALYESMKSQPESSLSQQKNTYNMLHSLSINLQDFEMSTYFYEKFTEYFGEYAPVIANQAVLYINTGNVQEAVPLMRRAMELDPNLLLADQFKQILSQYPNL